VVESKASEIWLDDKIVKKAEKGNLVTLPVGTFLRLSDKLYKWADAKYVAAQTE
jgi:hypothetical protein